MLKTAIIHLIDESLREQGKQNTMMLMRVPAHPSYTFLFCPVQSFLRLIFNRSECFQEEITSVLFVCFLSCVLIFTCGLIPSGAAVLNFPDAAVALSYSFVLMVW